jgi:hypothetical protein
VNENNKRNYEKDSGSGGIKQQQALFFKFFLNFY